MDYSKEDIVLIKRCLDGEQDAFAVLVDRYKYQIYNLAYRLLGNKEEAKDVAQEAFLRAYRSLHKYKIKYNFFTWLYTIAINVCRNRMKDYKKMYMVSLNSPLSQGEDMEDIQLSSPELTPEEILQKKRNSEFIQRIINYLPAKYRLVIVLKYIHDLPYNKIAEISNLPLGTVKIQIHRARKMLKEFWDKETKNKF